MKELPNLKELTAEAKDALIVELWEKIQKSEKQLEKKPKKTWHNSSLPPAQGFKANVKSEEKVSEEQRSKSIGRERGGRSLSETRPNHQSNRKELCRMWKRDSRINANINGAV